MPLTALHDESTTFGIWQCLNSPTGVKGATMNGIRTDFRHEEPRLGLISVRLPAVISVGVRSKWVRGAPGKPPRGSVI
jgi:hypothetical protein